MFFEWDQKKAKVNLAKHRVSFEEAATIFGDPFSITIDDPDHSMGEHRLITVGRSAQQRILVVVHTDRGANVRIITARKATKVEKRKYEEEN